LHLCGHWEKVQHWRQGNTDWVMDAGHRSAAGTFSVVHVGRDQLTLVHRITRDGAWHEKTLRRDITPRWK
jgi:hypothetical protein